MDLSQLAKTQGGAQRAAAKLRRKKKSSLRKRRTSQSNLFKVKAGVAARVTSTAGDGDVAGHRRGGLHDVMDFRSRVGEEARIPGRERKGSAAEELDFARSPNLRRKAKGRKMSVESVDQWPTDEAARIDA